MEDEKKKFCKHCGIENDDNSTFCRNCGKRLSGIHSTIINGSVKSGNNKKILIVGIITLLIAVTIVGTYAFVTMNNNEISRQSTTPTYTTPVENEIDNQVDNQTQRNQTNEEKTQYNYPTNNDYSEDYGQSYYDDQNGYQDKYSTYPSEFVEKEFLKADENDNGYISSYELSKYLGVSLLEADLQFAKVPKTSSDGWDIWDFEKYLKIKKK